MAKNDDRKVKRGVYLYIDGKEINNDITSIQAEIRQLTKDIKDMQIGSEEYTQTVRKIRTLRGILKEHKDTIRQVTDETKKSTISFGRFVDGFNRFGGFIASMVASLTGLILGLRSLRDEKNKLESSQASLKALTGLDDDSISWLTQQAQVLSTTMTKEGLRVKAAANEILDAYMLVGSAKPELLSDKEALAAVTEEAMRMQAAAGDITLAQAVDALTLSLNQYGAEADQAARFTNVLAAGSKEGAANIASQTAAIRNSGVAAASANVSFEETVALIQTLAYSGIKDEVAGTALKKFFLVLQTGADDVNPKIVGLSKALENLKTKNMGAADIKDMFGEEGYNAASVILQNIDMVNRYTEAVTGTSVAQEQAAINSATAEAKLAQVRNEMKLAGIELIEKLNPAIMVSTNAMTYVIKILPGLIDWIKKYKDIIVITAVTLGTYVTTLKLATFWEQKLKGEKLSSIIVDKAKIAWTKALTAAGYLQAAAMFLLTTRFSNLTTSIRLSLAAMKMFFATLNLNPFAVIITSVTALAIGIY
ncbi:phage tail tape measure protein, partial [Bacteroides caecigallinarum]|uniref:phage tail tape measure protein n=1 Tax=Bacteroides caecigallinarum TaxID=1411144 RepID=UPI001F2FB5E2